MKHRNMRGFTLSELVVALGSLVFLGLLGTLCIAAIYFLFTH